MPTPSKRYMNWTGCVWTPTSGGTAVPIQGTTNVEIDYGGSLVAFSGDGDHYATTKVNDFADPKITITTADQGAIAAIPIGQKGTLTGTHNDAVNQGAAGGGALVYTLSNGIVGDKKAGGQHRQYGQGTLMFEAISTDGYTNPLATSAA